MPGSTLVCAHTCGVRAGPPMPNILFSTRRTASCGTNVASTARSSSSSKVMSQSWQWPSGFTSSSDVASSLAVRQLGQTIAQRRSKSPAGTPWSIARSTSRLSACSFSASSNGRIRTRSASLDSRTYAATRSASSGATPSRAIAATPASSRVSSATPAGPANGLGAPARTWASIDSTSSTSLPIAVRPSSQTAGRTKA